MSLSQDALNNAAKLLAKFHRLHQPHGYVPSRAAIEAIEARHGMSVHEASAMIDKAAKTPGAKVTRSWGATKVQLPTAAAGEAESALSKMTRMAGEGARKLGKISEIGIPSNILESYKDIQSRSPLGKLQARRRKAINI